MVHTSSTSVGKYREEGVTTVLDVMTQTVELMLLNSNTAAAAGRQCPQGHRLRAGPQQGHIQRIHEPGPGLRRAGAAGFLGL